jgi:hypothetical protein
VSDRSRRRNRNLRDEDRAVATLVRTVNSRNVREERDRRTDKLMKELREQWRGLHPGRPSRQIIAPRSIRQPEFFRGVRVEKV